MNKNFLFMFILLFSFNSNADIKVTGGSGTPPEIVGKTYSTVSSMASSLSGNCFSTRDGNFIYYDHLASSSDTVVTFKGNTSYSCVRTSGRNLSLYIEDYFPPWCDSDEVQQITHNNKMKCNANKGKYTFVCDSDTKTYTPNCDYSEPPEPEPDPPCHIGSPNWPQCADVPDPEPCEIGSPNWPACEPFTGDDPTTKIDPPPPLPDIPNIEDILPPLATPPTEAKAPTGTDNDSNTDLINSIVSMNSDVNQGMDQVRDGINLLNQSSTANNELLLSQMKQDLEIYENNKALIGDLNNDLVEAIGSLGESMSGGFIDEKGIVDGINGSVNNKGCDYFQCSGNAASCWLARKTYESRCSDIKALTSDSGAGAQLAGGMAEWGKADERSTDALYIEGGDLSNSLSHYSSSNGFNFNKGCPAPYRVSVPSLSLNFDVNYQPLCDLAGVIRYLILASASFLSIMMIVKYS